MSDAIKVYRHYLATLAFRARRITDTAPDGFAEFEAGSDVRTPLALLRHMSVLMHFTKHLILASELSVLADVTWEEEVERFYSAIGELDESIVRAESLSEDCLFKALQGPLADAMTHVGQLAMMSRLAGAPIERASYFEADIVAGKF